jgi:signal transduction histidine kinase
MRLSVFPVMELVRDAAGLLEVLIEEKKLSFTLAGDESAFVRGDRLFLRQAVVNILHNAVKFTPIDGTISLRVSCEADSKVVLSVTDNGPGIPAEHATQVFDRFYRVDRARTPGGENGAGLGLSIARWAVRANEGEIGLSNSPGGGCTFWIRLPAVSHTSSD